MGCCFSGPTGDVTSDDTPATQRAIPSNIAQWCVPNENTLLLQSQLDEQMVEFEMNVARIQSLHTRLAYATEHELTATVYGIAMPNRLARGAFAED